MMVNPAYRAPNGKVMGPTGGAVPGGAGVPASTVNGPEGNMGYSPGGAAARLPAGPPPTAAPNPMQLQMLKSIASTQGPDAAHAAVAAAAPQMANQVKQVSGAMGAGAPGAAPPVGSFGPGPEMLKAITGTIAGGAPPGGPDPHIMTDIGHFPPDVTGKGSTYPQDAWSANGQTMDAFNGQTMDGFGGRAPSSGAPKAPPVPGASGMRDPNAPVPGAPPKPKAPAPTGQWRGSARFARQRAARGTTPGIVPQPIVADKGVNQDPNANRDALMAQLRARLGGGPAGGIKPQNIAY